MLTQWFSQLTLREHRTLFIGALALGGILGYFVVWVPLLKARDQLENAVFAQQATLLWMQQAAQEVQQLRSNLSSPVSPTNQVSLLSLIEKSTSQNALGKVNKRIEPKSEQEVQVEFAAVSFTELMRWLGELYNQNQIQVSTISLEKILPGQVKARLTLTLR